MKHKTSELRNPEDCTTSKSAPEIIRKTEDFLLKNPPIFTRIAAKVLNLT